MLRGSGLIHLGSRLFKWNFISGFEYCLGYQPELNEDDEPTFDPEVLQWTKAFYLGFNEEDNEHTFFEERDGALLEYRMQPGRETRWQYDSWKDTLIPTVNAQFYQVVPNGLERDLILDRIGEEVE